VLEELNTNHHDPHLKKSLKIRFQALEHHDLAKTGLTSKVVPGTKLEMGPKVRKDFYIDVAST
jgi:hypothetical protein